MAKKSESPFFKPEHFLQIDATFIFANTTTGTDCRLYGRCRIEELGEDWVIIRVPKGTCMKEHRLLVHFMPRLLARKFAKTQTLPHNIAGAISVAGVAKEANPCGSNHLLVKLKFTQYNEKDWSAFVLTWERVQKQVTTLVKKVAGRLETKKEKR